MGYQVVMEIPDGDFCLKLTDPYILCPFLVVCDDFYYCPFNKETDDPMPEILGSTTISKGGVVKRQFCPSKNPVRDDQIDFWTYQKLREIREGGKKGD